MIKNALTVDVEDYFHVSAMASSIRREDWDALPSRVELNTAKVLELFEEFDVTATFFVLGWIAQRFPGLVREIQMCGHEVACHGMSHRLIYDQKPEDFRVETYAAKQILEDLTGKPVEGYRAASFSITRESMWALDIIIEVGFRYDTSVFPVRRDLYGIPTANRWPHTLKTEQGHTIIEFPPTTVQMLGIRIPAAGGGFFRIYPYALTREFMRHVNRDIGQPCMFYLHPWELDPDQPRIKAPLKSRFRHYLNLSKVEQRMRRLLRDFSFGPVRHVLAERAPFLR